MSELPSGWARTTLGTIADWGSGGTPSRSESSFYGGGIPWIKSGELNSHYITTTEEYITETAIKSSSAKIFPAGSVAIAMYGATIGKTAILGIDASTNQACAVGVPVEGLIEKEYLYRLLQNEKAAFIEKGKGGAQPNISQAVIKSHEIGLPPLAEQTRIAAKLDELLAQADTLKARINGIPALLKRFRQSVLAAAVSGVLTEKWRALQEQNIEWKEASIDSVCASSFYGPRFGKGDYVTDGLPTIRTTDMTPKGEILITSTTPRVNVPKEKIENLKICNGDLLVTRTGSIGTMAVFRGNYEAIPSAYLIRFRFKQSVSVDFIYTYLTSPEGQEKLGLGITTTAQPNINAKTIRGIMLNFPSIDEQTEIVRNVDQLFAFADQLEAKVALAKSRIDQLTQSILAKAFRGELVPQDPNDEPASALLKRIKTQRTAAPQAKQRRRAATPS